LYKYELVVLVYQQQSHKILKIASAIINQLKNKKADCIHIEDWGKKELAYPVKRMQYAHYFLMQFVTEKANLILIDKYLRQMRVEIMRYFIIKLHKNEKTYATTLEDQAKTRNLVKNLELEHLVIQKQVDQQNHTQVNEKA